MQRLVRYLMASFVLAEAHEKVGERVMALAAWLTCRVFFVGNLGVGEVIDPILDGLRARWGEDEMAVVVAEYEAYVRMHGQFVA